MPWLWASLKCKVKQNASFANLLDRDSIKQCTNTIYLMLKLINFIAFCNYALILNLRPATCSNTVGIGACLLLCWITFSSTTQILGTEDTKSWSLACYNALVAKHFGVSMVVLLPLIMHQFSSSTLLWSHAVATCAEWCLPLSCEKMQGCFWKWHLHDSICYSKTCMYLPAVFMSSQIYKWPMPCALTHLHIILDAGF